MTMILDDARQMPLWTLICRHLTFHTSGAGTNLKVGGTGLEQSGGTDPARIAGKMFFWSCPSTFCL